MNKRNKRGGTETERGMMKEAETRKQIKKK
jgi:hypothetical protein